MKLFAVNARMRVCDDVFGTDEERSFAVARETVHDPMAQKAGVLRISRNGVSKSLMKD
jgi:hypothetical protein